MTMMGVLLAAGHGRRWQAAGGRGSKLLHHLPDGTPVAVAAARTLQAALPCSLAVVSPADPLLAQLLSDVGLRIVWTDDNPPGLGRSLAAAVKATPEAAGWVVMLGDMPFVQQGTVVAVAEGLGEGHSLVAPFHEGRRGHPVGFGRCHRAALAALEADEGARELVRQEGRRLLRLAVDDPGILLDIDEAGEVEQMAACRVP